MIMSTTNLRTLAGLGYTYDSDSAESGHSSSGDSYDSLFSQISEALVPSDHDSDIEEIPAEVEEDRWQVAYYPEPEPEARVNELEPFPDVPDVSDLMPWPTSLEPTPEARATNTQAVDQPQPGHTPLTPAIDRGYEADADSPRARRRQNRREAYKAFRRQRVYYLGQQAHPAYTPSHTQNATTSNTSTHNATEGLGLGLPVFDNANSIAEEDEFVGVDLEQDISEHTHTYASDSDSDSDVERGHDYDSFDSDEDHYYDESHLGEYDYDPEDTRVHYLVQHFQPIVEELPSLEELQARMAATNEEEIDSSGSEATSPTPQDDSYTIEVESPSPIPSEDEEPYVESAPLYTIPTGVGLGLMFDYPFPPPPPHPTPYDGFDTIDLSDDAPPHAHTRSARLPGPPPPLRGGVSVANHARVPNPLRGIPEVRRPAAP
ncbi:hypothetical protein ONZ51_g1012 [Trametes cubensis]|uniref:Uncharacterized protein n=1 Tax=Trametes cubensis TaxID=1111947 RepID=A0AAD7U4I9_9APHY|nr:hypothetical protein ONZ51_g1012 [Trametes cubensis]